MTRRRRKFPGWDHHALSVMARLRELAVSEMALDRLVAEFTAAEIVISESRAAGSDVTSLDARLDEARAEIRRCEATLAEKQVALGVAPRPPQDLCPAIAAHLDSIGLEDLRL